MEMEYAADVYFFSILWSRVWPGSERRKNKLSSTNFAFICARMRDIFIFGYLIANRDSLKEKR